jgi:hypothetical protein
MKRIVNLPTARMKRSEPAQNLDALKTMVFDDEAKYVQFIKYIYEHLGGKGLELTDAPITTSVRVRPWLIRQLPEELANAMHPVTDEDIERVLEQYEKDELLGPAEAVERFPFVRIPTQEPSSQ